MVNNFLYSWFSMILKLRSYLKSWSLIYGLNLISNSFLSLGGMTISFKGLMLKANFFKISIWSPQSKLILIYFLLWLTKYTVLVQSEPTLWIPKSIIWSSDFSNSNFIGTPSPWILTSIVWRLLIFKVTTSLYLI